MICLAGLVAFSWPCFMMAWHGPDAQHSTAPPEQLPGASSQARGYGPGQPNECKDGKPYSERVVNVGLTRKFLK